MGQTWHAPAGTPRPAHRMGLYLRRDLSREGERRRAGHALVRHRRHGGAPHRDQCRRRSRRPGGADRRSGRLALDAQGPIDSDFEHGLTAAPREEDQDATQSRRLLAWPRSTISRTDGRGWRRRSADHSRLGAALQRPADWTGWSNTGRTLKLNADHRGGGC